MPRSSRWFLYLSFPYQTLYAPLLFHTRATFPTHLILIDHIPQIIFGDTYKLRSSSRNSL